MTNSVQKILLDATIPEELSGKRLDQAIAILFPDYSRSQLKDWIEKGYVLVNGTQKRPRDKVANDDIIKIQAEQIVQDVFRPEAIALDILFEDEHLMVVNKPLNFVVHPAAGNWSGTLVNALLHHYPASNQIPRMGIVHRLDKDTTGLMVIAKSLPAHTVLVSAMQKRKISRIYEAVVKGILPAGGTVNAPLGRSNKDRKKRAVVVGGKEAVTHYRVVEKLKGHTHLRIQLETGRTHQIRVHMLYIYHPIVGDKMYGRYGLNLFPRQALHAKALSLIHPFTKEEMSWEVPLPEDMVELIRKLKS